MWSVFDVRDVDHNTERARFMIILRDIVNSDENKYKVLMTEPELTDYLSRFYPNNCSVSDYDPSRVCWFMIEENASCIGSVWLERDPDETDTMMLGIFISGDHNRNRGIGSYAIKEAIRISKQRMPFQYVRLNVRKNNLRAIRCYEKCGFKICGEGRKNAENGVIIEYYQMVMKIED